MSFITNHGTHGALITSMFTDNPFLIATGYIAGTLPDVLPYFDNTNRANTLSSLKQLKIPKLDYSDLYRFLHHPQRCASKGFAIALRIIFAVLFMLHPEIDRPMHKPDTGKYFLWAKILTIAHIPLDIFFIYKFLF